ncbi:MAG: trypsin-like peptidase domain-containing protein [Polyangiaceae bacterium]|nr:trypsin-like peptidase domain-containing protein [Polyangiaceae bacterium]MCB9609994.1 trypsin-like peptidase domain-containing protein [Polyangiaceae bacterium]
MSFAQLRFLTVLFACLFAPSAFAQAVAYDNIDQATVRVLGMGNIEIEPIEDEGQTYQLALPIAGHGSGVLLSKDGLILTAAHVIQDTRALAVLVPGRLGPLPAVTVYVDTTRDFALLRVKGDFEHVAELADPKATLAIRQDVFAIGYPLDATRMDPQSTPGIVSGVRPSGELQLGMSVNPGNSGGPVVDSDGKVRGIVVSRSRLDEGAVGLAYAVPLQTFAETAKKYVGTPADAAQRAYLEADTSRRLADLTSLMSLYGVDVLKTSLSKSEMEVDPRIKGALDEASEGAHASTDGRLLSAVFYWNQSLVMRSRGDTNWPNAQAKAVSLVREAAKAEPTLQTTSKFVKLLLSLSPAPPVGAAPEPGPSGGFGSVNLQPPADTGPPAPPTRPREKPVRFFLEAGGDYLTLTGHHVSAPKGPFNFSESTRPDASGFGVSVGLGLAFAIANEASIPVAIRVSHANLDMDCGDCTAPDGEGDAGTDWTQDGYGASVGYQWSWIYVGVRLDHVNVSVENSDIDASLLAYGMDGGIVLQRGALGFKALGGMAIGEYSGDNEESLSYISFNLTLAGQLLF